MAVPRGFGDRMTADEAASMRSSSVSSPPTSPPQIDDTIRVAHPPVSNSRHFGDGVAAADPAHATNGNTATLPHPMSNGGAPEKPKRQRRKKETGSEPKEKRPRKPREPTMAPRKKPKTEEKPPQGASANSRQPTIMEMVHSIQAPSSTTSMPMPPRPQPSTTDTSSRNSLPPPTPNPPTPRPISSGQNYDPVRGYDPVRAASLESAQPRPANPPSTISSAHASPHVNRASAAPSIASLIDPPAAVKTSAPPMSYAAQAASQSSFVPPPQHHPPTPPGTASAPLAISSQSSPSLSAKMQTAPIPHLDGAMDIDLRCDAPKPAPPEIKTSSKSSSSAPTPKAARTTPPPPPPPPQPKGTGSGLLSNDVFGGPASNANLEPKRFDIELRIPLNPQGGNTVNIAHEIAKKYGRDALNPRAAAHREQLQKFKAAANNADGGSADDMSVDLMSELDGDSNVEMGGMEDEKSGTGLDGEEKPKRKRRKKVEEYDKEDDFIDDTELAWQEQAAVAKDGFFVYSGPLVPEGQTALVESSAPTRGGRGRGRGRGRGSAATGTTHASLAEKSRDPNALPRGGRGRARGTSAPRKPRITKADRERMDAEKLDRERHAAHVGGPSGAPIALAPSTASHPTFAQQQAVSTAV